MMMNINKTMMNQGIQPANCRKPATGWGDKLLGRHIIRYAAATANEPDGGCLLSVKIDRPELGSRIKVLAKVQPASVGDSDSCNVVIASRRDAHGAERRTGSRVDGVKGIAQRGNKEPTIVRQVHCRPHGLRRETWHICDYG